MFFYLKVQGFFRDQSYKKDQLALWKSTPEDSVEVKVISCHCWNLLRSRSQDRNGPSKANKNGVHVFFLIFKRRNEKQFPK